MKTFTMDIRLEAEGIIIVARYKCFLTSCTKQHILATIGLDEYESLPEVREAFHEFVRKTAIAMSTKFIEMQGGTVESSSVSIADSAEMN